MKALRFLFAVCLAVMVSCTEKQEEPEIPAGDVTVPELPADPEPGNTSFNHRILLLQHTGTYCSNCPNLMTSLKALSEMDEYTSKYQHVAAHSYNEDGDPAYSQAAANLSQAFCSGYYPELTFNLTKENTGTSLAVSTITGIIDQLHKETADVGISAAAVLSGSTFGSHACFYSDATVLASAASRIENMEHAFTQLPYAVIGAVLTCICLLVSGFLL
jgi:hypothetical protein